MQLLTLQGGVLDGPFEVPNSTGYQTYAGLLSLLSEADEEVADMLHGRNVGTLTNSGVMGVFDPDGASRPHHKRLLPRSQAKYRIRLGITDPDEEAILNALVQAVVMDNESLELAHGAIEITGVETEDTTPSTILQRANGLATTADGVAITFERPTCRQVYGDVFETAPHRTRLFPHLATRWNSAFDAPEHELTPDPETIGKEVYTQVDTEAYETYGIVVGWDDDSSAESELADD